MNQQIDYRNGKYQGETNNSRQRDGLGIFIDDDLTFYISHWSQNKMNGNSLIYISHGKYVYGEWKNNEPHGLVVFRSGETVIVGRFNRGKPVKRSLVIFQRFNFACIMDQDNGDWRITDSGQLVNHDTLMKYIQMIGVPVPDHYFSLTKFACHFAKHSHLVKAYPCLSNCCYFGYNDGLAIVFNSNNALISIGAHCNESLRQFGGRFDGLRSAQQGNFEKGGEVVRYTGERPSTKIYSIFQRIHKKSLSFKNQYFDSKLKIFTSIENLLKSKLQQITNQCKKNKSMRNVDLNESLSYQQYTEEESFKINEIRDALYGQSEKNTPTNQRQFTPKNIKKVEEKIDVTTKYFKKKNIKQLDDYSQNEKREEDTSKCKILKNKTPKKQLNEPINQTHVQKRKCSIQRPQQFTLDNNKKSLYSQAIHKREDTKDIQYSQPTTPSKLKEKMRSNNLRYINTNIPQSQGCQDKQKSPIAAKSNNIYKEISQKSKKNEEQQKKIESIKSHDSQNFKVPNFKYLIEQAEKNKNSKSNSNYQPQRYNIIKKDNLNDRQMSGLQKQENISYKNQNNQMYRQVKQPQSTIEQSKEKPKKSTYQMSPARQAKKSIDISSLKKPNYEDIQERRKRILRQYKDLNSNGTSSNNQANINKNEPKTPEPRPQSPYNKIAFSLSKQQQSSFGFLPISISQKTNNVKNTINNASKNCERANQRAVLNEKITNTYDYPKKESQYYKNYQKDSQNQRYTPSYPSSAAKPNSYNQKDYRQPKNITHSNQKPGSTPTRAKKNYQYLYE